MLNARWIGSELSKSFKLSSYGNRQSIFKQMAYRKRNHPCTAPGFYQYFSSVTDRLQEKVACGELSADRIQVRAAKRLDRLLDALTGYSNRFIVDSWHQAQIERIREQRQKEHQKQQEKDPNVDSQHALLKHSEERPRNADASISPLPRIPRGLYFHGPVGTGKSMLMDLFFNLYSNQEEGKGRRVHFHSFMNELHQRIHDIRKQQQKHNKSTSIEEDQQEIEDTIHAEDYIRNPVQQVALQIASETTVLCLDEFQVTDVGNAYILTQLLEVLLTLGTVVVATSNQAPDNLSSSYQGSSDVFFSTFVALLQRHCITHHLDSDVDYRTLPSLSDEESMYLISNGNRESLATRVESITEDLFLDFSSDPYTPVDLHVGFQRHITVTGTGVGRFTFDELCRDNDYGTLEFRAIARYFPVLVFQDIPALDLTELRNIDPARRFVTLMDELYEARVALVCTGAVASNQIFASLPSGENDSNGLNGEWTMDSDALLGDLERVKRDKPHAYKRAISRLTEMTSRKWWDRVMQTNVKPCCGTK